MTLKIFRMTLLCVDCTKYYILTLASNIHQNSLKIPKFQELVKFGYFSVHVNWCKWMLQVSAKTKKGDLRGFLLKCVTCKQKQRIN